MAYPLLVSLLALAAGAALLTSFSRRLLARDLGAQISALEEQVVTWQSMHDHQVASMDRRLLDLEECAARAEEETRVVSLQMQRVRRLIEGRGDEGDEREPVLAGGGGW